MHKPRLGPIALAATVFLSSAAAARCRLEQVGVLPVDMDSGEPVASVRINGVKARFLIDSGAFYTVISQDAAAQYHLPVRWVPGDDLHITGASGADKAHIAIIKAFTFLGATLRDVKFLTIDQNIWNGVMGSLGQNLLRLRHIDTEYDLADGIIRFIKPIGCGNQPLAYWAGKRPYSVINLEYMNVVRSNLIAHATLNGRRISVMFDTGTARSLLTRQTAARAGITTHGRAVTFSGLTGGIGPTSFKVWTAPVARFRIGGEKIEHTHLLVGNFNRDDADADMILGDDFFLSHRIYIAYSQNKVYFTYNGGPLFNMNLPQFGKAKSAMSAGTPARAAANTSATHSAGGPAGAAALARRGAAEAAMREFTRALADLSRACALAPTNAEYHFQRGEVYWQDGQPRPALKDFDAAIKLRPEDSRAHLDRAAILLSQYDAGRKALKRKIESDLAAVSRLAQPGSDVRLSIDSIYDRIGDYSAAIDQDHEWLVHHPLENDQAQGLNSLCWIRATADRNLHQALSECDRALNIMPFDTPYTGSYVDDLPRRDPDILDSRGLVYLRLGRLADAIDDYDSALRKNPKIATSLYGRGLAELRQGEKTQGQSDLAAAKKIDPNIGKRFARMGLKP